MAIITPSRTTGALFGPVGKSLSCIFVTDSHSDPIKATEGTKYYQDTRSKITDIVSVVNARDDINFLLQNGDWVDGSASKAACLADLAEIQSKTDPCTKPVYPVIGNHDVYRLSKQEYMDGVGQPAKWYSFVRGGIKFIVLDGNFRSDANGDDLENSAVTGNPGPYVSYIQPEQREWLENELSSSNYPCVIFCHYPLYYVGSNSWGITNAAAVRAILEEYDDRIIGCLGGHLHDNFIRKNNGILYASLHATVTGAYPSLTYSVLTFYPNTLDLVIRAVGYEMSHVEA